MEEETRINTAVFVDAGTFINGEDNRCGFPIWDEVIEYVKEITKISNPFSEFKTYINPENPREREAARRLERVGSDTVSSMLIKNDTDMRLQYDFHKFVRYNRGEAVIALLIGDSNYIYAVRSILGEFPNLVLYIFGTERSCSNIWKSILGEQNIHYIDHLYSGFRHIQTKPLQSNNDLAKQPVIDMTGAENIDKNTKDIDKDKASEIVLKTIFDFIRMKAKKGEFLIYSDVHLNRTLQEAVLLKEKDFKISHTKSYVDLLLSTNSIRKTTYKNYGQNSCILTPCEVQAL